jgi:hypothetical protein
MMLPSIAGIGSQFVRVPVNDKIGFLRSLPGAARTVYEFLHRKARFNSEITVRDREAAFKCGICRRTFQKGLQQLQALELIQRVGRGVNRIIHFIDRCAKSRKAPTKVKAGKPAAEAPPPERPAPAKAAPVSAAEQEEVIGELKRILSGNAPSPMLVTEEEKVRQQEEKRRLILDQLDAMKAARKGSMTPTPSDQGGEPIGDPPARE